MARLGIGAAFLLALSTSGPAHAEIYSWVDDQGVLHFTDVDPRRLAPEQAIFGAARYLRILANDFGGDLALTAAAYNAGADRVRKANGIPAIVETRRYVERVLQLYRHYRGSKAR